ncbi:MAG: hypothetical protein EXR31_09895 [Betaproteobacteria bacterium]|nr:hypothetical protein [Betaproteobacteria bacterium]
MTATAHSLEHLRNLAVSVRAEQILRAHYPDLRPVAAEVRATAAAMAVHALEVATPVAWLREVAVREIEGARVALDGGATLTSSALAAVLHGGSSVQLFLVTLGPRLDERVTQLFDAMDGLEGLFLDTAGWIAVQSALSMVRRRLGARARAGGYRVTRRVGPGYLDWALDQAPVVVETLAAGQTLPGIEVLDSGAILPEKTLTGLYGLIPLATSN